MSFSSTSVVPRVLLTPALGTWAPLFAGYAIYLSQDAAFSRGRTGNYTVDASDPEAPQNLARRSFSNFMEYVPMTLLLAGVCELNGASPRTMNVVLALLFSARVAHAEFGLKYPGHLKQLQENGYQVGRFYGFLMTNGVLAGLGGYAFALTYEAMKQVYA